MWIGNDLIEADVVEKQRAREIYETILREKRDPGLLEWTSGNLFKARVFPIEAHSEKRIKIVYTQVLPLRANRYRYSYGLRSDLLRTKPLRELSVSVQVNSALPLKSVTCPTHTVRTQQTAHSAQVDFAAQEYIPDRDFEVVCEIDGRNSDVVVIPHRRGDDGYLLLQLTPPGKEGNWQREILPDGKPLQLVLLCDTSASMDSEKRKQQAEFVATVLSSLGEKDRFLLAAADVETTWASPEPMAATPENIDKAREFFDERVSLGWTNLDQAFAAVLKQAPADAQIIYIGDGIVTAGEANPVSFVKHLGELLTHSPTVPVGANAVPVVSRRHGRQHQRFDRAARHRRRRSWLGARDQRRANAANRGERATQRNLAAGSARSERRVPRPESRRRVSRSSATSAGGHAADSRRPLFADRQRSARRSHRHRQARRRIGSLCHANRFERCRGWQLVYPAAVGPGAFGSSVGAGTKRMRSATRSSRCRNSSTSSRPTRRCWCWKPMPIGSGSASNARFEMRDGERFFAEGRANANYELLQQQMKRAGDWRIGLRRQVLANLSTLGRNVPILQQQSQEFNRLSMPSQQRSAALEASPRFRMTSAWWSRRRRHGTTGMNLECRPALLVCRLCAF